MFTSESEIRLGAKYKDVVTGHTGICVKKSVHLTGCDTATIETSSEGGKEAAFLSVDVTRLEYIDDGIAERFEKKPAAAVAGGPAQMGRVTRKR